MQVPFNSVSSTSLHEAGPTHVLWKMESKGPTKVFPKMINTQENRLCNCQFGWGPKRREQKL